MALTVDFQKYGVTFEDAYVKIMSIQYNNTVATSFTTPENPEDAPVNVTEKVFRIMFIANIYSSDEVIHSETYYLDTDIADDIVGACYEHLKTLDAFANAVDA